MEARVPELAPAKDPFACRSLREVAEEWHRRSGQKLSMQRVQQIHDRAMEKLREAFEAKKRR